MTVSGGMLARIFSLVIATVIITPTFYARAVETEAEDRQDESTSIRQKSANQDKEHVTSDQKSLRKAACIKVRTSISNRTANLQQASERRIGVIDKVYGNLTTYANDKHILLPDQSLQAVLLAHDAASDAIQQLANSEDALNCEDTNVGQAAMALKLNIQAVNDTMRAYRKAVGDMLATVKAQALTGEMNG